MKTSKIWISAAVAFLAAGALQAATVAVAKSGSGWAMTVDGRPFFVQGVAYVPEKVGEDPSIGNLRNWQDIDDNRNGLLDSPYESFIDANTNGRQDPAEPTIGDFELMRNMGVNTIRVYHHSSNAAAVQAGYGGISNIAKQYNHAPNKAVLRDLHDKYGISVAMGDFFGAYRVGSGVDANHKTEYTDPAQVTRMLASVQQMVTDFKDESFLLMYVLGNENNYDTLTFTNAISSPTVFASAVGQAVALIKSQDANHPVAICLGDYPQTIIDALKALPSGQQPDILGSNVYRNPAFEGFFSDAANPTTGWDKPVMFTEYGDQNGGAAVSESHQNTVMTEGWNDILASKAGGTGSNNSIGGIAFEWNDNWWQSGAPAAHTVAGGGGFENEWHGFFSQGSGENSPRLRVPRQVYTTYQSLWGVPSPTVHADGDHFFFTNFAGGASPLVTFYTVFLDVPAGSFATGTTFTFANVFSFPSSNNSLIDFAETGIGFTITPSGTAQPARPLTLSVPFNHQGKGFVLARWDAARSTWILLPTRRDSTGALIATTDHLSLFQVMQVEPSETTENLVVYPNPARPARGDTGINFTWIPPGTDVKLYTPAGEFVRRIEADLTGIAFWDLLNDSGRSVASGVYIAIVDGNGGKQKFKVAVQR